MRIAWRARILPFLVLAGLTGCDRTPTDPTLDPGLDEALLAGARSAVYSPSTTSLSSLFRASLARTSNGRGALAPERLLADWRRLNEEARTALSAGDQQTARVKVDALRAEEIRIVQRHLGYRGVVHVVEQVAVSMTRMRMQLASSGRELTRARQLLDQVAEVVLRANQELEKGNIAAGLDHATRASDLLDGVAHYLITLQRIPALETQFPEAAAKLARDQGIVTAQKQLARVDAANQEARAALRSGDRERARRQLEVVRREQIHVVLRVFGTRVVPSLIAQVDTGIGAARADLRKVSEPRHAERAHKMLGEAASLNGRARAAADKGDAATALDLASHAAGLVNAARHLLPR
ncbi:MAG: hypothetical protein ACRENP_06410 [Longimicrobiales bacterium]